MKSVISILLLMGTSLLCSAQTVPPSPKDLSKLSSPKLKQCQIKPQLCGFKTVSIEINDELAKLLNEYSIDQVLACYKDWKICGVEESKPTGWPISDYLASLGNPHDLLVRYWREKWIVRNGIERVAYHFDTPEVTQFMRAAVKRRVFDGEDLYWPANYLAKKCDPVGLAWLRSGKGGNQGSMQYSTTLELFGKCGYRPAIPLLVNELYDFAGNNVVSAENSLDLLYPDHPKDLDNSLESVQRYYCRRARKEGFRVHCDP